MKTRQFVLAAAALAALSPSAVADDWNELQSSIRDAGDVDKDGTSDLMIADAGAVLIVSGKTHSVLLTLNPPDVGRIGTTPLASSMDNLGDVDADGRSDLVVCWKHTALACVYSGLDGRVVFVIRPAWRVASAGDLDLDGVEDVLVGPGAGSRVEVRSGRDGALLLEIRSNARPTDVSQRAAPLEQDLLGASLAALGDTDGDGHGDFVVGAPGEDYAPGRIELYSGRDGRSIAQVAGDSTFRNLGWSMVPVGDVDQDGACDVLVGAIHRCVALYSGRDLRLIYRVESRGGIRVMDAFASSLDVLGDIDGDGIGDWIVGANETAEGMFDEGYAQVHSGKNGALLRVEFESTELGVDVCGVGDINGDGVRDEAVACPSKSWVRLLSGKDGTLISEIDVAKLRKPTARTR